MSNLQEPSDEKPHHADRVGFVALLDNGLTHHCHRDVVVMVVDVRERNGRTNEVQCNQQSSNACCNEFYFSFFRRLHKLLKYKFEKFYVLQIKKLGLCKKFYCFSALVASKIVTVIFGNPYASVLQGMSMKS